MSGITRAPLISWMQKRKGGIDAVGTSPPVRGHWVKTWNKCLPRQVSSAYLNQNSKTSNKYTTSGFHASKAPSCASWMFPPIYSHGALSLTLILYLIYISIHTLTNTSYSSLFSIHLRDCEPLCLSIKCRRTFGRANNMQKGRIAVLFDTAMCKIQYNFWVMLALCKEKEHQGRSYQGLRFVKLLS